MEYSGLFKPYPANRLLKDEERQRQLHQKQRLEVDAGDDVTVIRFNATYLELMDKWLDARGIMTSVAVMGIGFGLFAIGVWPYFYFTSNQVGDGFWLPAIAMSVLAIAFLVLPFWLLKTDAFRYTHFPIRLNRKTKMVHVFRTNGTVLSVPWDEVFFCVAALPQNNWEIQGHVLDADGTTVKETFALPVIGTGERDREQLSRYWEFVRRYMEEGPSSVARLIEYCLPIAERRESFADGFHHLHARAHAAPAPILIGVLLIYLVTYPGRWFALRTSKIPQWPAEIEAVNVIETNDPYRKDSSGNAPVTDHTPIYFVVAISIALLVWVLW